MEKKKLQSKQKPRKGSDGLDRKTGAGGKNQEQPEPKVQKETSPHEKSTIREKLVVFSKSRIAGKQRGSNTSASDENETQQNRPPELPPKTYKYYMNTALNDIQVHRNSEISEEIYTNVKRDMNIETISASADAQPDQEVTKKEEGHKKVEEEVERKESAGREDISGLSETMTHNKTQNVHKRNISALSIGSFHVGTPVELIEELFFGEEWTPFLENDKTLSPEDSDQSVTNTYSLRPTQKTSSDVVDASDSDTEHTVLEDLYLKFIIDEAIEVEQPATSPVQEELSENEAEPVGPNIEDILKTVTIIEPNPKVVKPEPEEDEALHTLPPKLVTSTATATFHRVFRSSVFYKVPHPDEEPQVDQAKGGAKAKGKKKKKKAVAKKQSSEETDNISSVHMGTPDQLVEEPFSGEERAPFSENQKTLPPHRPLPTPEDSDQSVTNTYYLEPKQETPSDVVDASDSDTEHTPVLEDHYSTIKTDEPTEVEQPATSPVQEELPENEAEPVGPKIEKILKSVTFNETKPKVVKPEPEEKEPPPLPAKLVRSSSSSTVFRSSVFYEAPPGAEAQVDQAKGSAKTTGKKKKAVAKKQSSEETDNIGSIEKSLSGEERALFLENQKTLPPHRPLPTPEDSDQSVTNTYYLEPKQETPSDVVDASDSDTEHTPVLEDHYPTIKTDEPTEVEQPATPPVQDKAVQVPENEAEPVGPNIENILKSVTFNETKPKVVKPEPEEKEPPPLPPKRVRSSSSSTISQVFRSSVFYLAPPGAEPQVDQAKGSAKTTGKKKKAVAKKQSSEETDNIGSVEKSFSGEERAPFSENQKTLLPYRLLPTPEDSDQSVTNTYYLEPKQETPSDVVDASDSDTEHTPVLEDHYPTIKTDEPTEVEQPATSPVQEELPENEAEPVGPNIENILKSVTFNETKPKVVKPEPEEEEPHPLPPKRVRSSSSSTVHRVFRSSVFYEAPPGAEPQVDQAKGSAKTMGKKKKAVAKKQSSEETDNIGSVEKLFSGEERAPFSENQKTLPPHRPLPTPEDSDQSVTNTYYLEPKQETPSDVVDASDSDTEHTPVLKDHYPTIKTDEPTEVEQPATSPVQEELPENEAEPVGPNIENILKSVTFSETKPKVVKPEPEEKEPPPLPPKRVRSSSSSTLSRVFRSSVFYLAPPGAEPQVDQAKGSAKTTGKKKKAVAKKQSSEETDNISSVEKSFSGEERAPFSENQKTLPPHRPLPTPEDSDQSVTNTYYLEPKQETPSDVVDASDSDTEHTPVLKDHYPTIKTDEPTEVEQPATSPVQEELPENEAEPVGPNIENILKSVTFSETKPKVVKPEPEEKEPPPLPAKLVRSSSSSTVHRVFRSSVFYLAPPGAEPQVDQAKGGAKKMGKKKKAVVKKQSSEDKMNK